VLVPGQKVAKAQQLIEERRAESAREDALMQDVTLLLRGLAEREEVTVKLILDCLLDAGAVNLINSKIRPGRTNRMLKSTARRLNPVTRRIGYWWFKNNVPELVTNWLRGKIAFAPEPERPAAVPAKDAGFFNEWTEHLPEITDSDRQALDRVRQRYLYHREAGPLREGAVNVVVVSALLELAGLLDPPFRLRPAASLPVALDGSSKKTDGTLEVLGVHDRLWICELETKRADVSVRAALPHLLEFLSAKLKPEQPLYGAITNGDEFVFVKVLRRETTTQYDLSDPFVVQPSRNRFYDVLQVLRRLGRAVTSGAIVTQSGARGPS